METHLEPEMSRFYVKSVYGDSGALASNTWLSHTGMRTVICGNSHLIEGGRRKRSMSVAVAWERKSTRSRRHRFASKLLKRW